MTREERLAAVVVAAANRVADRVISRARRIVERAEWERKHLRPETPLERERRERGQ